MQRLQGAINEPAEADIPAMELSPAREADAESVQALTNVAEGTGEVPAHGRGLPPQNTAGFMPYAFRILFWAQRLAKSCLCVFCLKSVLELWLFFTCDPFLFVVAFRTQRAC